MGNRIETDSMGNVEVAADRYWGAQTQRSLENFKIGGHRFGRPVIGAGALPTTMPVSSNVSRIAA